MERLRCFLVGSHQPRRWVGEQSKQVENTNCAHIRGSNEAPNNKKGESARTKNVSNINANIMNWCAKLVSFVVSGSAFMIGYEAAEARPVASCRAPTKNMLFRRRCLIYHPKRRRKMNGERIHCVARERYTSAHELSFTDYLPAGYCLLTAVALNLIDMYFMFVARRTHFRHCRPVSVVSTRIAHTHTHKLLSQSFPFRSLSLLPSSVLLSQKWPRSLLAARKSTN